MKLVPAQSGICGFEVIQPVSAWLVKAERVGAGLSQDGRAKFFEVFRIEEELLYIMRGMELE